LAQTVYALGAGGRLDHHAVIRGDGEGFGGHFIGRKVVHAILEGIERQNAGAHEGRVKLMRAQGGKLRLRQQVDKAIPQGLWPVLPVAIADAVGQGLPELHIAKRRPRISRVWVLGDPVTDCGLIIRMRRGKDAPVGVAQFFVVAGGERFGLGSVDQGFQLRGRFPQAFARGPLGR
jgi:hypothetical protein